MKLAREAIQILIFSRTRRCDVKYSTSEEPLYIRSSGVLPCDEVRQDGTSRNPDNCMLYVPFVTAR